MKVLINGFQLSDQNTGVQYYTEYLLKEMVNNEDDIEILPLLSKSLLNCFSEVSSIYKVDIKNNRIKRILFENFLLPGLLKKNKFDIYHSPNYILPYRINTPSVLTVHDTIAIDFPEYCRKETVLYFKWFMPYSVKKASGIIAVSNTVKNDIVRRFNVSPEKIHVIYHGINPIFKKTNDKNKPKEIKRKFNLPDKYILFVGNIEPKKNIERLIKAFHKIKYEKKLVHKLVIVGKKGWKFKPVFDLVKNLNFENDIVFTGYVKEEYLPCFYSNADLFVFPSLYEGFGIPPLEAMACEVPVIVSDKGALPEITGGKCLQVDPYSINDIAKGIYSILSNNELRIKTIKECNKWVKQFSWEKSAEQTIKVYNTYLGK